MQISHVIYFEKFFWMSTNFIFKHIILTFWHSRIIAFIMDMMTIYEYVIIHNDRHRRNVTRTRCSRPSRFCFVFFTYESQPSVPPVEHKRKHLETDTFPKYRGSHIKTCLPENKENIASFCSSFRIGSIFRA